MEPSIAEILNAQIYSLIFQVKLLYIHAYDCMVHVSIQIHSQHASGCISRGLFMLNCRGFYT